MELSDLLKKYWFILLVAVLGGFLGYRLRPEGRAERTGPGALVPAAVEAPDAEEAGEDQREPAVGNESAEAPDLGAPADDLNRYQLVEVPIMIEDTRQPEPKTFTQDSPEVKKALSDMDIQVYAAPDSEEAKAAAAFFEYNHLKFTLHDTSDAMESERARRLGRKGDAATIVVDDEVLPEYSAQGIQDVLLEATKKRVLE